MESAPSISVIMPVFDAAAYVEDAILSVLAQDFGDFELILVDDGSRDASGAICDWFAARDQRIRVVHQKNAGMCAARNLGIKLAKGEFIAFCDDDDIYLPDLLSRAHEATQVPGRPIDCVFFGRVRLLIDERGRLVSIDPDAPAIRTVLPGDDPASFLVWMESSQGVWCRLYRRQILIAHGVTFDEQLRNGTEDVNFNLDVFSLARGIAFLPTILYVWYQRQSHSASLELTQSKRLGLERYLDKLHRLLTTYHIAQLDPAAYKRLMLAPFRVEAGMMTSATQASLAAQRETYRFFGDLYQPYIKALRRLPGEVVTMGALEAISYGLFGLVWAMTHGAAALHHATQRLRFGATAQDQGAFCG